jgi:carotenoid cleavage dioxygenase-like enzyme
MGNRFLEGNFGPVREELTLTELDVTGTIPEHPRRALRADRAQPRGRP